MKEGYGNTKSILLDEGYTGAINCGSILIKPAAANPTNIIMVIMIAIF
jgi:hypothetical protein